MKYRKRPVVIEAFRYGYDPEPEWFVSRIDSGEIERYRRFCEIPTLEGVMRCVEGDYVVQGIKGEVYPCKADIFAATYEPVEQGESE